MEYKGDFSPLDRLSDLQAQVRSITNGLLSELANLTYPPTPEVKEDYVWDRANEMQDKGELPEFITAWDVYDDYQRQYEGE